MFKRFARWLLRDELHQKDEYAKQRMRERDDAFDEWVAARDELQTSKYLRTWAVDIVTASSNFRERLYQMMKDDKLLVGIVPEEHMREHYIQKMAAEFVANIIFDVCKGITCTTAKEYDAEHDKHFLRTSVETITITSGRYHFVIPVQRPFRAPW